MTVRFNLAPHSVTQGQMIEVYDGDVFVAGIYPDEHGVRLVSKYLANDGRFLWMDALEPPTLNVKFPISVEVTW